MNNNNIRPDITRDDVAIALVIIMIMAAVIFGGAGYAIKMYQHEKHYDKYYQIVPQH